MRLARIELENWIAHGHFAAEIRPLTLFCGPNAVGKSAVLDAVAYLLLGDIRRGVGKSAETRKALITAGHAKGSVSVAFDRDAPIRKDIATGKLTAPGRIPLPEGTSPAALNLLLDPSRLGALAPEERRRPLLDALGVRIDVETVFAALKARGLHEPILRNGRTFPSTDTLEGWHKAALARATEARGAWRGVTGEVYGHVKADEWAAPEPDLSAVVQSEDAARARDRMKALPDELATMQKEIGALDAAVRAGASLDREALNRASLVGKTAAAEIAARRTALADAETRVMLAAQAYDEAQRVRAAAPILSCPECGCDVELVSEPVPSLRQASATTAPLAVDPDARERANQRLLEAKGAAGEYARQVAGMETAIREGDAADNRLLAIAEIGAAAAPTRSREQLEHACAEITAEIGRIEHSLRAAEAAAIQAAQANQKTRDAAKHHAAAREWSKLAELLAPDGIAAETLACALKPLHDGIAATAAAFGWGAPAIAQDMQITVQGRPYELLSESERWRADAVLAIAIARHTKIGFVMLDRLDVLEPKARAGAFGALYEMLRAGVLHTVLAAATLKAPISPWPADAAQVWLGPQAAARAAA